MGHGNKLNFKRTDLHQAARNYFAKRGRLQETRLVEALFHQRQREACPVHGNIQIPQNIGQRPDMIFMAVRQHDCADLRTVLLQVGDVGNDQINAKEFRLREHHARVDDDDFVTEPQCHHVHAEFAEAAQRNGGEGLRGLAQ